MVAGGGLGAGLRFVAASLLGGRIPVWTCGRTGGGPIRTLACSEARDRRAWGWARDNREDDIRPRVGPGDGVGVAALFQLEDGGGRAKLEPAVARVVLGKEGGWSLVCGSDNGHVGRSCTDAFGRDGDGGLPSTRVASSAGRVSEVSGDGRPAWAAGFGGPACLVLSVLEPDGATSSDLDPDAPAVIGSTAGPGSGTDLRRSPPAGSEAAERRLDTDRALDGGSVADDAPEGETRFLPREGRNFEPAFSTREDIDVPKNSLTAGLVPVVM